MRRILLSLPVLAAAFAVALYALAGFFLAPYLISREIPRFAEERLQARATLGAVRVNPFLLTLELRDFRLVERDGRPAVAFERLFVDFDAGSLTRRAWTFAEIALEAPRLELDVDPAGELNLLRLANRLAPAKATPAPATEIKVAPARMLLRHIAVARGRIAITDRSGSTPAQAQLEPVSFELKDLSTLPDLYGDHTVGARLPAGGTLAWRGKVTLQPISAEGEVKLQDFKFATAWRFLRDQLHVQEPAGSLDLEFRYRARFEGSALQVTASEIAARAAGLALTLRDAQAPGFTLGEAALSGGTFDLAARKLSFSQLALRRGDVTLRIDEAGALDWQGILAPAPPGASAPVAAAQAPAQPKPWQVVLDAVRVEELALHVTDATRTQPLAVEVGRVDAAFGVRLGQGEPGGAKLSDLQVQVTKVALGAPKVAHGARGTEPALVTLESIALEGGSVDVGARTMELKALKLRGGQTIATRQADGTLNLALAFAPRREQPPPDAPFSVTVGAIELAGHRIAATDHGFDPPYRRELEGITLKLANVTHDGAKPAQFELAAAIAQGGKLSAAGSYHLARNRAEGKVAVSRIALPMFDPLLASLVTLKLASGSASAEGRFNLELDKARGHRLAFKGGARIDDLLLNDSAGQRFAAGKQIVASGVALDLQGQRLAIEELRLVAPAGKLLIAKDRSTNLSGIIRQSGQAAAAPAAPAAPLAQAKPAAGQQPEFAVVVDRVRVENGELEFADLSLVLPFATRIQELNGTLSGLASDPSARAGVKLEGRVDEYGLARAAGTINPFAPRVHTDLAVVFRNVAMPPLSAYSATFAGRRIASGKLSLDLQYKITNSELAGENRVELEQFTLGERVESQGAMDLPLDLAIALLTDGDGKIDLAVPVRGNVDHPEFSYGHIVWQAIRTVLVRIVTAPFRALAALFGGSGENLDDIAFDAGSARLLPPEQEKLAQLAGTLGKRPQISLVVQGRYHPERDGAALREAAARQALAGRLAAGASPSREGKPAADPGPVAFDNARAQREIEAMLAERGGADALTAFVGAFEKQQGREAKRANPVLAVVGRGSQDRELYEAMFRRLVELQALPPGALEQLARERAAAIAQQVAGAPGIGAARVAQKDPVSGEQVSCKLALEVAKAAPQ